MLFLAEKIKLPREVVELIINADIHMDDVRLAEAVRKLLSRNTWNEGLADLKKMLGEDSDGMKMLTVMLQAALLSWEKYKEAGISEEIFVATMKCFSRFVNESMERSGRYYFNRDFWTPRQLALQLFRIGELEYELVDKDTQKYVSIHIPSDADMNKVALRKSYELARDFLKTYFPEYADVKMSCESWLLSPALKELLPADSRIRKFQENFIIEKGIPDVNDYAEWVYGIEENGQIDVGSLPEKTSLQRAMKTFLLAGGKVGIALGSLKEEPFKE